MQKVHFSSLAIQRWWSSLHHYGINTGFPWKKPCQKLWNSNPTENEVHCLICPFVSGVQVLRYYTSSPVAATLKRNTNLDDALCSFPRVLWNSVALWPMPLSFPGARMTARANGETHVQLSNFFCVVSCHFFFLQSFRNPKKNSKRYKSTKPQTTTRFLGFPTVANIRERFINASWCPAWH